MRQDDLLRVVARLYQGLPLTSEILRTRYGCSPAGAKRVLRLIEDTLPVELEVGERNKRTIRIRSAAPARAISSAATRWMQL